MCYWTVRVVALKRKQAKYRTTISSNQVASALLLILRAGTARPSDNGLKFSQFTRIVQARGNLLAGEVGKLSQNVRGSFAVFHGGFPGRSRCAVSIARTCADTIVFSRQWQKPGAPGAGPTPGLFEFHRQGASGRLSLPVLLLGLIREGRRLRGAERLRASELLRLEPAGIPASPSSPSR